MAAVDQWLIDKSALIRLGQSADVAEWATRIDRGLVRITSMTLFLAERGQHRPPMLADLLIAAVAETRGLTMLHVDKDFELIGGVTGQAVQRLR
jgi:predicted nucleic acid-binding protein